VRSLLIAPFGAELGVLRQILQEAGLPATSTVDLGAGIALARASLSGFDAAVVVLPKERNRRGLPAVLIETGIAAARELPLLLIVPPDEAVPSALATVQAVKADVANREALSLHVGLFARSLEAETEEPSSPSPLSQPTLTSEAADAFEARLAALATSPLAERGRSIESLVMDILLAAGANVEAEPHDRDRGVDAAAVIPGEEQRLGLLVIEVKDRLDRASRTAAERRLQSYVLESRAGLGLLIYATSTTKGPTPTMPLVFSMSIDQLIAELRHRPLGTILVRARNEAIHRM